MSNFDDLVEQLLGNKKSKWLVTGCAGFIGSNIVECLLKHGQEVVGLDNFITGKKKNLMDVEESVGDLAENFTFIEGDVRNIAHCEKAVAGCDYVLHQAALGSVPRSIEDPLTSHDHNVNGQLNILWASLKNNIKKVVYASSSSVYGSDSTLPKIEKNIGNPLSPYAATKRINEIYSSVFSEVWGLNCVGVRYFNVFGRRQDPDSVYAAVIPKWIKAFLRGDKVEIYGDGTTSRDFCYVKNAIYMNILLACDESDKYSGKVFNCACGMQTTLNDLFVHLSSKITLKSGINCQERPLLKDFRKGDVKHSLADYSLAAEAVGYKPLYLLEDGLAECLDWYLEDLKL